MDDEWHADQQEEDGRIRRDGDAGHVHSTANRADTADLGVDDADWNTGDSAPSPGDRDESGWNSCPETEGAEAAVK